MELDFKLHEAQMEIFTDPSRFKVVAAGRRFGKSYLSAVMLLIEGLKNNTEDGRSLLDKRVFYVAPTFDQGKRIIWDLLKMLGRQVIKSTLENQAVITLINDRKIEIKGADRPDTLRGVGLSFVVLDEFAFMKPDVWEKIIRPTLSDVKGGALFIGTPDGKNHFYDVFKAATEAEDWTNFSYASRDNPTLDPDEIKHAKDTMSATNFMQEYEASFTSGSGTLFKESYLKVYEDEPKEGLWYIAVDPAGFEEVSEASTSRLRRLDECAIVAVKVNDDGWFVEEIDHGRWGIRETSLRILKAARKYHAIAVGIEKGSLKNAIMPYLYDQMRRIGTYPNIVELTHGGKKKVERISWALQGRFEHGRIYFRKDADWLGDMVEQLLDFPNPLAHDDLIDALAYIDQIAIVTYNDDVVTDEWEPLDAEAGY